MAEGELNNNNNMQTLPCHSLQSEIQSILHRNVLCNHNMYLRGVHHHLLQPRLPHKIIQWGGKQNPVCALSWDLTCEALGHMVVETPQVLHHVWGQHPRL